MYTRGAYGNAAQRSHFNIFVGLKKSAVGFVIKNMSITEKRIKCSFYTFSVRVKCSPEWKNQHIVRNHDELPMYRGKRYSKLSDSTIFLQRRRRSDDAGVAQGEENDIPLEEREMLDDDDSVEVPQIISKPSSPLPAVNAPVQAKAPELVGQAVAAKEPLAAADKKEAESVAPAENPFPHEPEKVAPAFMSTQINFYDNAQFEICRNYTMPLTKKLIEGKVYYNMSVS